MTIDLDMLEKLAKAATPGDWEYDGPGIGVQVAAPEYHRIVVGTKTIGGPWMEREELVLSSTDAEYISAVKPAVVLALISRLRAAEGIVRDLAATRGITGFSRECEWYECHACNTFTDGHRGSKALEHETSCPWRRATEYVK